MPADRAGPAGVGHPLTTDGPLEFGMSPEQRWGGRVMYVLLGTLTALLVGGAAGILVWAVMAAAAGDDIGILAGWIAGVAVGAWMARAAYREYQGRIRFGVRLHPDALEVVGGSAPRRVPYAELEDLWFSPGPTSSPEYGRLELRTDSGERVEISRLGTIGRLHAALLDLVLGQMVDRLEARLEAGAALEVAVRPRWRRSIAGAALLGLGLVQLGIAARGLVEGEVGDLQVALPGLLCAGYGLLLIRQFRASLQGAVLVTRNGLARDSDRLRVGWDDVNDVRADAHFVTLALHDPHPDLQVPRDSPGAELLLALAQRHAAAQA